MTYRVVVSPRAEQRLLESASWYLDQSRSIEVALRWYDGFHRALAAFSENPSRFALASESSKLPLEVRELFYGSGRRKTHRALFRVVDDQVLVLTVRHFAERDATIEEL
ncbi:MAG: type II toxin-antitoxin system RelE/ParE family toxin [Planctomycetaceae bacterium]